MLGTKNSDLGTNIGNCIFYLFILFWSCALIILYVWPLVWDLEILLFLVVSTRLILLLVYIDFVVSDLQSTHMDDDDNDQAGGVIEYRMKYPSAR